MNLARATVTLFVVLVSACSPSVDQPAQPQAQQEIEGHTGHTRASAPPPQPVRDGERFVELSLPRPFTPSPERGTDEYRCFLIDPGLGRRTFLTGSQFLPDNAAIVHHAIFFRVPAGDVAEARDLDARTEGDGWTCFGGAGIVSDQPLRQLAGGAGAAWIGAWAPGAGEAVLAEDVGYEMAAGSQRACRIASDPGPSSRGLSAVFEQLVEVVHGSEKLDLGIHVGAAAVVQVAA